MSDYFRPAILPDALALLSRRDDLIVLAGGTDLYPERTSRAAWGNPVRQNIVDISAIDELRGIVDRGDYWWIGALVTWSDIIRADLPPIFDGLKSAAREIGGLQIQNRGTIAGNICTASPAGDSIPCLLALDAQIELASAALRCVDAAVFFTGYRKTALASGELVTGVRIPKQRGRSSFRKLGTRRYLVISIVMVSVVIDIDDRGCVRSARIAVGACSATAQRLPTLETALVGNPLSADHVSPQHFAHLSPIDDLRASANYRRHAACQLTRDTIADLVVTSPRETADV